MDRFSSRADAGWRLPLGPEPLTAARLCRFSAGGRDDTLLRARDDYDLLEAIRVQLPRGVSFIAACVGDPDLPVDVVVLQDLAGKVYAFSVDHGACGEFTASFHTDVTYASPALLDLLEEWWTGR